MELMLRYLFKFKMKEKLGVNGGDFLTGARHIGDGDDGHLLSHRSWTLMVVNDDDVFDSGGQ